jgi:microcompartment protein CcmK/EutM
MIIGRVVGTVVATQKDEKLRSSKLLVVETIDPLTVQGKKSYAVAVDAVGAGIGEVVLCASGSSARLTPATENRPVDTVIMAIVDHYDIGGRVIYRKSDVDAKTPGTVSV